jgi:hypothetical protein
MYVDKYELGQYKPKSENTDAQNIGQIQLLVGKYKKIEVTTNTNRFMAHKAPLKIENALLHPRVKVPTRACKAYNTWKKKRVKLVGHTWRRKSTYIRYGKCQCSIEEQVQ